MICVTYRVRTYSLRWIRLLLTSGSGYTVKVFQCGVQYDDYLGDLDKQLVYNLKDKAEKDEQICRVCALVLLKKSITTQVTGKINTAYGYKLV